MINFHDISPCFVLIFMYNDDTMIMDYEPLPFLAISLIVDCKNPVGKIHIGEKNRLLRRQTLVLLVAIFIGICQ